MRGYSTTKSQPFQFSVPLHKYPRSSKENGDFGENFYKVLCSWMNFRDFISIGSIAEVDKIRSVFTTMFQANQKQMVKKHKKAKFRGKTPHIVKIDLAKIDENLKLSNKEKRRLRHILNKIKYRELGKQSNKKEMKRKNEKSVLLRKTKTILTAEKNQGRTRRTQSQEIFKEKKNWQRGECRHCKLCSKEENPHAKRNQRKCLTMTTPSEERIFKTLMNLDRSCCGDSFKTLFGRKSKRTFITQNQNINIENLELKYIQPTCLVQYTGMKGDLSISVASPSGSGIFPKESFSPSALREMTERFNGDIRTNHLVDNSLNKIQRPTDLYGVDETYEGMRSTFKQRKYSKISGDFDIEEQLQSLKSFSEDYAKRYSEDRETSMVHREQTISPYSNNEDVDDNDINFGNNVDYFLQPDIPKKNITKYRKFKNFAKKCLCLCGTEDDNNTNLPRYGKKGKKVNAKLKKMMNPPDAKVKYMTESNFLDRKKEINK